MTGPHALKPFLLAFPGPLRDRLVAAVLSGEKTATTGLLLEYEAEKEELPEVGERSALIDSDGREVAVVEITEVQVLPLRDADLRLALAESDRSFQKYDPEVAIVLNVELDLRLALAEGEGYRSVAEWRAGHEDFWHGEEMREALGDPGFVVDGDTMLVVEWFRVVEVGQGA
ncbi:ASCH domain-containing protein [Streptomyces cinereoruber]|uniref:ASCH domain-containing protein n=1 Tax=Streptomyces cinereoruber TaxID=67260 RepID=UPI00363D1F6A